MENTESLKMTEITQTIPETPEQIPITQNPIKEDIRQSDNWAECLKLYNWKAIKTSNGNNIYILKTPIGGFVKIQRPKLLDEAELDEIEKICKENNALFIKLDPNIGQDLHLLEKKGYRLSKELLCPSLTIYIDLEKTETELWNGLSHSAKYSVNRAKREGAYTELIQNPNEEQLEKFYKVDLEGISDPRLPKSIVNWGGFSHFKERFNGVHIEFPWPQIKYFSPLLKIIDKIYGRYVSI